MPERTDFEMLKFAKRAFFEREIQSQNVLLAHSVGSESFWVRPGKTIFIKIQTITQLHTLIIKLILSEPVKNSMLKRLCYWHVSIMLATEVTSETKLNTNQMQTQIKYYLL